MTFTENRLRERPHNCRRAQKAKNVKGAQRLFTLDILSLSVPQAHGFHNPCELAPPWVGAKRQLGAGAAEHKPAERAGVERSQRNASRQAERKLSGA